MSTCPAECPASPLPAQLWQGLPLGLTPVTGLREAGEAGSRFPRFGVGVWTAVTVSKLTTRPQLDVAESEP